MLPILLLYYLFIFSLQVKNFSKWILKNKLFTFYLFETVIVKQIYYNKTCNYHDATCKKQKLLL